ncbi:hypothetical protein PanWU01x14_173250, partial [Parasponia andersonii]
ESYIFQRTKELRRHSYKYSFPLQISLKHLCLFFYKPQAFSNSTLIYCLQTFLVTISVLVSVLIINLKSRQDVRIYITRGRKELNWQYAFAILNQKICGLASLGKHSKPDLPTV